jgi:hypothetical protein
LSYAALQVDGSHLDKKLICYKDEILGFMRRWVRSFGEEHDFCKGAGAGGTNDRISVNCHKILRMGSVL